MGYKQVFVKGIELGVEFDAVAAEPPCFKESCPSPGGADYVDLIEVKPAGSSEDILDLLSDDAIGLIVEAILND